MKKWFLLATTLWSLHFMTAQTALYKTSWAPDGGSAQNGQTVIQYTMAETFVREATVSSSHISEGFIGPDMQNFLEMSHFPPVEGLHLFPNPVKDILYLRFEQSSFYQIKIYDLSGKKILETQLEGRNIQLDLRNLKSGYYLLVVTQPDENRFSAIKIQKI